MIFTCSTINQFYNIKSTPEHKYIYEISSYVNWISYMVNINSLPSIMITNLHTTSLQEWAGSHSSAEN